ncbi:uncharacterized protein LOC129918390 [Episyrphus balteatus]|uniref:uncharacterized protein LOC129918390 n=1 Tax=Episyrphus balteatus TaxID=286459 RepID=UPI002484F6CA|nr:uncharacterized protein LOC129918390 [Episyrphus balteatus]
MAFMMPVMKNEFDIYNGSRTRKVSEVSTNTSANGQRSRKVSECKSECQTSSTSPSSSHLTQMNRSASSRAAFPRNSSRSSQSNMFAASPTRNYNNNNINIINNNQAASPPKTHAGSQGSLNKFHNRLVDKLRKSFRKDTAKRS